MSGSQYTILNWTFSGEGANETGIRILGAWLKVGASTVRMFTNSNE